MVARLPYGPGNLVNKCFRIGQIVPSSNVTMEIEIPAVFKMREAYYPQRFTFHSSRMRMKSVNEEELSKMDSESDRCALELSDASVDVIGYACLVAIMSMGLGYHRQSQERLHGVTKSNDHACPIVSSAGALVKGLEALGSKKIAIITPYKKKLTQMVIDYIEYEGIEVADAISLEIPDNLAVARQDPCQPIELVDRLSLANVDTIVASACVQMPSLPAVQVIQDKTGIPTVSASVATTYEIMKTLDLCHEIPGFGALFEGD